MSVLLHIFSDKWGGYAPANQFNHTSWIVLSRSAIDVSSKFLVAFLCCYWWFYFTFLLNGSFCHRTKSELFIFLLSYPLHKEKWHRHTHLPTDWHFQNNMPSFFELDIKPTRSDPIRWQSSYTNLILKQAKCHNMPTETSITQRLQND